MKNGLVDYLEILRLGGIEDWGPFSISGEDLEKFSSLSPQSQGGEEKNPEPVPSVIPPPKSERREFPNLSASAESVEAENMSKKSPSSPAPKSTKLSKPAALAQIAAEVAQCECCSELVQNRTQTVFGTGNPNSKLVFLGEAPGADEDKQGVPFVGRAGQLLTDMITKGMKLKREDVYICNILRCRPPGNRNPSPEEAENCRTFLDRTLEIVKPKYICCLGAVAAKNLLHSEESIGKMRGKVLDYHGIKVICTYHPAYLLRNPSAKAETWKDLQLLMKEMGLM